MEASPFVKSIQQHQRSLLAAADAWSSAIGSLHLVNMRPERLLRQLVLPLDVFVRQPLELRRMVSAAPAAWLEVDDIPLRRTIHDRLETLSVDLFGADFKLIRRLSDVAYESATYRTMISERDSFDVSAAGVLGATAMANLSLILAQLAPDKPRRLKTTVFDSVDQSLRIAGRDHAELRPGDLWLFDLIARTVRLAWAEHTDGWANSSTPAQAADLIRDPGMPGYTHPLTLGGVLDRYVASFIASSVIHKLLEVRDFPPALAKRCRYDLWPGIAVVIRDPQAESLRSLIVGELARCVTSDTVGLAQGAFFRFLHVLLTWDEPEGRNGAILLIARLLWEVLEQDASVLSRLMEREKVSRVLAQAISIVEQTAQQSVSDDLHRRLVEIRKCLQTYDQYRALTSLQAPMGSLKSPVHAMRVSSDGSTP